MMQKLWKNELKKKKKKESNEEMEKDQEKKKRKYQQEENMKYNRIEKFLKKIKKNKSN
jgi:hypothetical protein